MTLPLPLDGHGPLHAQIYRALRDSILTGRLGPGARLPATRTLAASLDVSRPVVVQAYRQLSVEGYVNSRVGSGTYVEAELPERSLQPRPRLDDQAATPAEEPPHDLSAFARRVERAAVPVRELRPADAAREGLIDFQYGLPEIDTRTLTQWRRLVARVLKAPSRRLLSYDEPGGHAPLRQAIAEHLGQLRAVRCDAEQVLIVNGSQQALDVAARLLVDPGEPAVIEEPHYLGARDALQGVGAELIPVPVDGEGLVVSRLWKRAPEARLAYVTPSHQFPTGATMSAGRRLQLLSWAESTGAYVLEDDYDGEFRYRARPLPAIQGQDRSGRVLYIGTFSKLLFPSLRIGYVVLPAGLVSVFRAAKWAADCHTSTLEQAALAELMREGHFEAHLRRSRKRHAARRAALLEAVDQHLDGIAAARGDEAGVHLMLDLPDLEPAALPRVIERGLELGVRVYSSERYYLGTPPCAQLLLGYASLSPERIRAGVSHLARALSTVS